MISNLSWGRRSHRPYFEAILNLKGAWPLTVGTVENSSGLIDSYLSGSSREHRQQSKHAIESATSFTSLVLILV